jgi:hypothetical protein
MTGRPKKYEGKSHTFILEKELIDWIDEIRKTPLGEIARPEIIRTLLRRAMEDHKK